MSKLYHKEVYWEDWFNESAKNLVNSELKLSRHMNEHLDNVDDKHDVDICKLYLIVKELKKNMFVMPFEVEVDNGKVTKCVIRTKYDDKRDISIVFRYGLIVTAYLNKNVDLHNSLDYSKYEKGGE
jgi:hypothetical protein